MNRIKAQIIKTNLNTVAKDIFCIAAVIILFASIVSYATLDSAKNASAVENFTTTSQTNTTTHYAVDALQGAGAQYGNVHTEHSARTTVRYPLNVRAGQTFSYTRCVAQVYLAETSGYEASIDRVAIADVSEGFSQIYTQGSTTRNFSNLCKTYDATAPSAGSTSMDIPAATLTSYGGVGYAGTCCPRWGLTWSYQTTDNTLNFNNVFTPPNAQDDGRFELEPGEQYTLSPLTNDAGFIGGTGTRLGTATAHTISTQATKGTCVWDGNNITYTNNGTHGYDSCRYSVNQAETDGEAPGNGATSATVTFLINTAPTAVEDTAITAENTPATVDVLPNDSDPDGDDINVTSVSTQPGKGTASIVDGEVRFDPGTDFDELGVGEEGEATVTYTITDEYGATATAEIIITLLGRYDHVIAYDDFVFVDADDILTFDPRENDFADNNNPFWVRSIDDSEVTGQATRDNVSITYYPQGNFDYLNEGETETVTLTYTISDDIFPGVTSEAEVTITINGVNESPDLVNDNVDTFERTPVTIDPLENDSDRDQGDTISLLDIELIGEDGSATISGNSIIFDPEDDFIDVSVGHYRTVEILYSAEDLLGATSTASVFVRVYGVNESPTANDDELTVRDRKTPTIDVLENDTDPDLQDELTIVSVTPTGTVTGKLVIDNGVIRWIVGDAFFTLVKGKTLSQTFEYTISDGQGGTSTANGIINLSRTMDNFTDADGDGIPDWFTYDYNEESKEIKKRIEANDGNGSKNKMMKPLVLPTSLDSCPEVNNLLQLVSGRVGKGRTVEVAGSLKWLPHSKVTYIVCSEPTVIKQVDSGSDGYAHTDIVIPKDLAAGKHQIIGVGLSPEGEPLVQTLGMTITKGRLSDTGANGTSTLVSFAAVLILLGFSATGIIRYRRS